jgi:uncharacterized protein DUF3471
MRCPRISMRAALLSSVSFFATPLAAQSSDTTFFVTTQGTDTVAIEHYVRTGNTITGEWIQAQGAIVHPYLLVLGKDGWPEHYVMTLYTTRPFTGQTGSLTRPHTFLLSVTYGADSATRIKVLDSIAFTERVVTQKAYPVGALSILATELALARARQSHTDSTTITLDRAQVRGPSPSLPVKFFGADSVRIGTTMSGRVDQIGRLLALRDGPRETRRVSSLPVATMLARFNAASDSAPKRVEIALPRATLERFVGEYVTENPTASVAITIDENKLMWQVGSQPPRRLLASSPTTFFFESVLGVTVEFETDTAGNVTALTQVTGSLRRRARKTK